MADYYHYDYKCPYMLYTDADRVCCDNGCRVKSPSIAGARRYIKKYCADQEGWKDCSIAKMFNEAYESKFEIEKGIKAWQNKQKKASGKS